MPDEKRKLILEGLRQSRPELFAASPSARRPLGDLPEFEGATFKPVEQRTDELINGTSALRQIGGHFTGGVTKANVLKALLDTRADPVLRAKVIGALSKVVGTPSPLRDKYLQAYQAGNNVALAHFIANDPELAQAIEGVLGDGG